MIFGILFNVLIIPGPLLYGSTLFLMLCLFLFATLVEVKNDAYRRIMVRMSIPLFFGVFLSIYPLSDYRDQKKYNEMHQYLNNDESNFEEEK